MAHIMLKSLLLEGRKEEAAEKFLLNLIKGTEWEDHVYIAGGYVRDQILGKDAKDIDLVVALPDGGIKFAEWATKKMGNYKPESNPVTFKKFGTAKFTLAGILYNGIDLSDMDIEAVMTRSEKYTTGSRKPDVAFSDLKSDVERRDATINSLLKKLSTGEILDLTGKGIEDIKNGVVRTPIDPDKTFEDDPLRILRIIRMSAKYDWKIPMNVLRSIKKNAPKLTTISKERIHDETNKCLLCPFPYKAFRLLQILGLMKYIFPSLQYVDIDYMKRAKELKPNLILRLVAALNSIDPKRARNDMTNLRYSVDIVKHVGNTLALLPSFLRKANNLSDRYLRELAYYHNDIVPYLFNYANVYHETFNVYEAEERYASAQELLKNNPLPVTGDDLINLGVKPSPEFKKIIDQFKVTYIKNPQTPRDEYLKSIQTLKTESKIANPNGFREVTFTDGGDEVMVHYDKDDEPIRAYIYKDSPLLNFDYKEFDMPKWAERYRWDWGQSINPLFYNLKSNNVKNFVLWLESLGYIRTREDL